MFHVVIVRAIVVLSLFVFSSLHFFEPPDHFSLFNCVSIWFSSWLFDGQMLSYFYFLSWNYVTCTNARVLLYSTVYSPYICDILLLLLALLPSFFFWKLSADPLIMQLSPPPSIPSPSPHSSVHVWISCCLFDRQVLLCLIFTFWLKIVWSRGSTVSVMTGYWQDDQGVGFRVLVE
jgi:hypothetical protein